MIFLVSCALTASAVPPWVWMNSTPVSGGGTTLTNPAPYNNLVMGGNVGNADWIVLTNIYTLPMSSPTAAGNTLIASAPFNPFIGPTEIVPLDSGGDTFKLIDSVYDSANGLALDVWEATNIAGNVNTVTFSNTLHGTSGSYYERYFQPTVVEIPYFGPVDVTNGWDAKGITITNSAKMNPSTSNDLVIQFFATESGVAGNGASQYVTNFVWGTNMNWNPLAPDNYWGNASQEAIYNSTSAINPTFSVQGKTVTATPWVEATVFLKPWALGQSVGGCRVNAIFHWWGTDSVYPGPGKTGYYQFPNWGNGQVVMDTGAQNAPNVMSNVTDTAGNVWFTSPVFSNAGEEQDIFSVCTNMVNGLTNITKGIANGTGVSSEGAVSSGLVYDIINGSIMSNTSNATGSSASDTWTTGTLTPSGTKGIGFFDENQANDTTTNCIGMYFTSAYCDGGNQGQSGLDQNGGWCYTNTTVSAAYTLTWQLFPSGTGPSTWGADSLFIWSK